MFYQNGSILIQIWEVLILIMLKMVLYRAMRRKNGEKYLCSHHNKTALTLSGPRFFRYRKDRGEVDSTPPPFNSSKNW